MITESFFKQWIFMFNNKNISWLTINNALINNFNLNEYYHEINFKKVKGYIFEYLAKYILIVYNKFKFVYLYKDIPSDIIKLMNLPKNDRGIDIICSMNGNQWIGVQCKWRSDIDKSINKIYVNDFIQEIKNTNLSYGIFFTNVKFITPGYENYVDNNKEMKWYLHNQLISDVNKKLIEYILNNKNKIDFIEKSLKIEKLRYYQTDAIKALNKSKSKNKQCIMACGTGKTVVMIEYLNTKKIENKRVVLLFPSIQLISQVYKQFISNITNNINILCICSDMDSSSLTYNESTSSNNKKILKEFLALDINKIYTTDIYAIKQKLSEKNILVFCTYQSCKLLKDQSFDIGIFDEAHKTVNNDTFGYLLYDTNCKINERIFFTATPKYYEGNSDKCISMSDGEIYGEVIYNYNFQQAIKDKYILDFQVVSYATPPDFENIITEKYIKKDNLMIDSNVAITCIQLAQHIKNNKNSKKVLTYHNSIYNATVFKKTLEYIFEKQNLNANIFVMSGNTHIIQRSLIIDEFNKSDISIICSSRVLNEGIDIPCVDTIVFVDPRNSTIDITQCIGRAMRLYNKLTICTVIIPIHYDNLNKEHNFSNIIKILTAMNDLDSKIAEYFNLKNRNTKISIKNMELVEWIENIVEVKIDITNLLDKLTIMVMESNKLSWEIKKLLLFEYCNENKCTPKNAEVYKKIKLGAWLCTQKKQISNTKDDIYQLLSVNKYVKRELDRYIENKINGKLSWDEWKILLFEYINNYKNIPLSSELYKNRTIGSWFHTQKHILKRLNNPINDEIYKQLCMNNYIKDELDRYLNFNQEDNWDNWKNILFEYCNEYQCVPPKGTIYKGYKINQWFQKEKKKEKERYDKNITEKYKKLSQNKIVKNAIDNYIELHSKEKPDWNSMKALLFEYCDKYKSMPLRKTDKKLESWIVYHKKQITSINDNIYKELSKNQIVKKYIDNYLRKTNKLDDI